MSEGLPFIEFDQLGIIYKMTQQSYKEYVEARLNGDEVNTIRCKKNYIQNLEEMKKMIINMIESEKGD